MTDYSEAELLALNQVFPKCKTYLCDFHREQCWQRWISDRKHGLSAADGDLILSLLRKMVLAESGKPKGLPVGHFYHEAEEQLRKSSVWLQNKKVQSWLESKWLAIPQVCMPMTVVTVSPAIIMMAKSFYGPSFTTVVVVK